MKKQGIPLLILDSGNLLSATSLVSAEAAEPARAKAKLILDAYARMGCDGLGVGELDLPLGLTFLKEAAGRLPYSILSANLVEKGSGKPFFKPHTTREVAGLRVAVFSVTNPQDVDKLPPADRALVEVQDPVETAKAKSKELAGQSEIVILLSLLGEALDQRIAKEAPDIDFILEGNRGMPTRPAWNQLVPPAATASPAESGAPAGSQAASSSAPMPVLLRPMDDRGRIVSRIDVEVRDRRSRGHFQDSAVAAVAGGASANIYSYRAEQMSSQVRDDEAVKKMIDAAKPALSVSPPSIPPSGAPSGSSAEARPTLRPDSRNCIDCHAPQVAFWRATSHARASESLARAGKTGRPDCTPCHVVGKTQLLQATAADGSGSAPAEGATQAPAGVGCEGCHTIGPFHDRPVGQRKPITAAVCKRCHTPEWDPGFDLALRYPAVACPSFRPTLGAPWSPARLAP